jgi:hypothetical protein
MTAKYPNEIADTGAFVNDTTPWLPNDRNDTTSTTTKHKNDHNRLADEIVAIETELGVDPKGSHADVVTRLDSVDSTIDSDPYKTSAVVAATTNVTIATPGATVDGVSMSADDRVLLAGQSTSSQNGLWVWNGAATPMTRPSDADGSNDTVAGMTVYIQSGTSAESYWTLTTAGTIVVDSDAQTFERKIITADADTKGDLVASTGSAFVNLAVGTDGQVLKALASEATGMEWNDAFSTKIGSFSTSGSIGVQAVTGVGFQPKLVFFFSTMVDDDGFTSMSIGAMNDAGEQFNVTTVASGTNRNRRHSSDRCISSLGSTGTYNRRAAYSSMESDGFEINWTTASAGGTVYYLALV